MGLMAVIADHPGRARGAEPPLVSADAGCLRLCRKDRPQAALDVLCTSRSAILGIFARLHIEKIEGSARNWPAEAGALQNELFYRRSGSTGLGFQLVDLTCDSPSLRTRVETIAGEWRHQVLLGLR